MPSKLFFLQGGFGVARRDFIVLTKCFRRNYQFVRNALWLFSFSGSLVPKLRLGNPIPEESFTKKQAGKQLSLF
jgi:hypothetical protein